MDSISPVTSSPLRFMAGTVVRDDLVFIAAQIEELNLRGIDHTKVLRWKEGTWTHYMLDWPAIGVVHLQDPLTILALGLYGTLHVASGTNKKIEEIDESRERPGNRGVLREIRVIDGSCHAVGMQRQAYRRERNGTWRRIDEGVVMPLNSLAIASFESIDGFNADTLYAAGFNGEIWRRFGGTWSQVQSPTSVDLDKVLCVSPNMVYASGQLGTIVSGSGEIWEVLDTLGLKNTISDLCWFKGALYASTSTGLYRWYKSKFEQVNLGLSPLWSYGSLASNGNVLWSIGRSHLAMTIDADTWVDVTCKDGSY